MPPRSYYIEPRASDYIAFARSYFGDEAHIAEAFIKRTELPYIENADHLASYIGVSASLIRQILHKKDYHYRKFYLPKPDGTNRLITTPKTYLKVIQWWIADNILSNVSVDDCVHGFVRGRSYVSNAETHLGAKHLLNVDIEKFFPSISDEMVLSIFESLGYGSYGAQLLSALCTLDGFSPTGAPTSPMIGNAVLSSFDMEIREMARQQGLTYTRYADDLTFSSDSRIEDGFANQVSALIKKFGFELNDSKTKFMGTGDRKEVTGVTINDFPNLSRDWRNSARGFLHRAFLNPHQYHNEWKRVAGIYGTLKALDPECRKKLTQKARETLRRVKPLKNTN